MLRPGIDLGANKKGKSHNSISILYIYNKHNY
jgi:hypothetical protein